MKNELKEVEVIIDNFNKGIEEFHEKHHTHQLFFDTYENLSKIYGANFNENGAKNKDDNYTNELLQLFKENVERIKKGYESITSNYFLYSYYGNKYSTIYEQSAIEMINEDKEAILEIIEDNMKKVIKNNSNLINVSLLINNLDVSICIDDNNVSITSEENILKIDDVMKQKNEIKQFLIKNCVDILSEETYLQVIGDNLQNDLEDDDGVL